MAPPPRCCDSSSSACNQGCLTVSQQTTATSGESIRTSPKLPEAEKCFFFSPLFVLVVVFLFLLQNCVNNLTISPLRCTASSPLAKPGKLLPLVSLSQEKKSGTSIQMITELGKPSLCHPLRPRLCARPRRSAPHHFCLDLSGCSQGPRCSHGFTLNTFCFLILCSG